MTQNRLQIQNGNRKGALFKYCCLSLAMLSLKAFAGQGMFVQINDETNSQLTLKMNSSCVYGTGEITLNKRAYIEANQSGTCFFNKSDLYLKLFAGTTLIADYHINLSAFGSSLNGDLTPQGYNSFIGEKTFYPHSGLSGSQDLVIISVSNPVDDWQAQMSPYITNLPLNKVPIPGSHDTGTYHISSSSFVTPDASNFLNAIGNTAFVSTMVGWAKTQKLDVQHQLERGIRYLDLRLCGQSYNGDTVPLTTCHSLSGDSLENVLSQIGLFLENSKHKKEIIFIDMNHAYNVDNAQMKTLRNLVLSNFGNKIASPLEFSPQSTYEDFWHAGKQVVLFWSGSAAESSPLPQNDDIFWNASTIESIWADKQDISSLKSSLRDIILTRDDTANNFFVLQSILSPTSNTIVNGIFVDSAPKSLLHFSTYKPEINSFLLSDEVFSQMKFKGNIMIEDFSNGIDLVSYCKKLIWASQN